MHFYARTEKGLEPRHFVPMTKDPSRTRPARMSDYHKAARNGEQWVPSVTTILNVLNKPALINWKVDQHLIQAYEMLGDDPARFPPIRYDDADSYIRAVKLATEEEMAKAPDAGSGVHESLEKWALGQEYNPEHETIVQNVAASIEANCGYYRTLDVERYFISENGYGGCIDLEVHPRAVHNPIWVIDYKTKQTAEKFKSGKMAYDEQAMQLAAYRAGIGAHSARCANLFICIETGEVDFHEHSNDALDRALQIFNHTLAIWQLQNGV